VKLEYAVLLAADLERLRGFYVDTLGLPVRSETHDPLPARTERNVVQLYAEHQAPAGAFPPGPAQR
jgi:catechol 2,3-dioxygenase-like lactoylglutathione lyase family enzyme